MSDHLRQSRISKALTDRANGAASFQDAERRLHAVRPAIVLMPDQAQTAAGQAAALTAVNASFKCFGSTTLVGDSQTPLVRRLPIGDSVGSAATTLGAEVYARVPSDATHLIVIGNDGPSGMKPFLRCWWDGWMGGVVPAWDERKLGASGNPLAGVFAGALAVREVFGTVLGYPRCGSRVSITSLWLPGSDPQHTDPGPETVYISPRLWFVGLGHLGQGVLWCLGLLPIEQFEAVLQDDQNAGEENEATGLLTRGDFKGRKKTRIAAAWLDRPGWATRLIERRHYGDIPLLDGDPSIVVTGLDEPEARMEIARNAGFEYLVDAGIGHGPVDFESLQIRILKKDVSPSLFWSTGPGEKNLDKLLEREAYRAHEAKSERCGTLSLANASVSVPFVGAAVGALTLAQITRLASMQSTVQMMQMELGAPTMAIVGATNPVSEVSRGSIEIRFSIATEAYR